MSFYNNNYLSNKSFYSGNYLVSAFYPVGLDIIVFPPCDEYLVQFFDPSQSNDEWIDLVGDESREEVGAWYFDGDGIRYINLPNVINLGTSHTIEFQTILPDGSRNITGLKPGVIDLVSILAVGAVRYRGSDNISKDFSTPIDGLMHTYKLERTPSSITFTVDGSNVQTKVMSSTATFSVDTLFARGDLAQIYNEDINYINLNGLLFSFEEGNQSTEVYGINRETGKTVKGVIQNATGADRVQTFDYRLDRDYDFNGYTESDGITYYEEEALINLVPIGKRSPNINGNSVWWIEDGL